MKHASLALLFLLAVACETTPRTPVPSVPTPGAVPALPIPVIETPELLAPPQPGLEEIDLDEAPAEGETPSGAREIHPHGGMADCLEMYSACAPDPATPGAQRCTSAPLMLACGQSGTIPGGERLVCVCP